MDVRCTRCGTEYEFDDALISERGTSVRCTQCGHQFKVFPPQLAGIGPDEWIVLTSLGRRVVYRSLRELQNGIAKADVAREDLLARGSKPPRPLGSIAELDSLFVTKAAPERQPSTLTGVAPPAVGQTKGAAAGAPARLPHDTFTGVAPPPALGASPAAEAKAVPPPGGSLGKDGRDTFSGVAPPQALGGSAATGDAKAIPPPGGSLGKEGHDTFSGVAPPPDSPEAPENPYANRAGAPLRVGGSRTVLGIGSVAPETAIAFEPRQPAPASGISASSPPETRSFEARPRAPMPSIDEEGTVLQAPPLPPVASAQEEYTVVEAPVAEVPVLEAPLAEAPVVEPTQPLALNVRDPNREDATRANSDSTAHVRVSPEVGRHAGNVEGLSAIVAPELDSATVSSAEPATRKFDAATEPANPPAAIGRVQLEKKLVSPIASDPPTERWTAVEASAAVNETLGLRDAAAQSPVVEPNAASPVPKRSAAAVPSEATLPVIEDVLEAGQSAVPQAELQHDAAASHPTSLPPTTRSGPQAAASDRDGAAPHGAAAPPHATKATVVERSTNDPKAQSATKDLDARTNDPKVHSATRTNDPKAHSATRTNDPKARTNDPKAHGATRDPKARTNDPKAHSATGDAKLVQAAASEPEGQGKSFALRAIVTLGLLGLGLYVGMKIVGLQMQSREPTGRTTASITPPNVAVPEAVPEAVLDVDVTRRLAVGDVPGAEQLLLSLADSAKDKPLYRVLQLRTLVMSADLTWWKVQLIGKQAGADYTQAKQLVAEKVERYKRDVSALGPNSQWTEPLLAAFVDVRKMQNEKGELTEPQWSAQLSHPTTLELKYSQLVSAWVRAGVPDESTILGLRQVRAVPSDWGPHAVALLVALVQMNRLDDAKVELKALAGQSPPHPLLNEMQAYVNNAEQANVAPRSSAAAETALGNDSVDLDSDILEGDFRVRLARASQCLARNELTRAQKLLRSVLVQRPNDTEAITAMGDLQKRRGDMTQARASYEKALSLNGNYLPALSGAADVKWRSGDRAGAAVLYRRIMERVGESPGYGQTAAARVKELEGNPAGAERDAKPAAKDTP